ncbi:MAG: serine/threonine protein kinase [Gammaproteobacteria bacterium]|nr:serine/threonine protein kinase [Gammaproteobacteria bacterium]
MADHHPFARLSPDLVMDAVESTGLRCDARILELNSYENRVFQIGIEDDTPVVGKFYRPERWTDEQIVEEHTFTLELAENDISAVPPLDLGGMTLKHYDGFRFALYPRRGGRAPELDDMENLAILGRAVGRIHAIGATRPFEHRPRISVSDYGFASRDYLLAQGFMPIELETTYRQITDELFSRLEDILDDCRFIRLHGDCHMGNVLWRDELPHFVDFDDARMGPAVQDLWMMLSGESGEASRQMAAILEGYRAFMDFSLAEIALIEPLRTLRLMYHAAWLARRWDDPAFPRAFPFFNTMSYWAEHLQQLREQIDRLDAGSLQVYLQDSGGIP